MNPHYSRIWQTVQQIPAGKVASYGQIADLAGLPGR
ncbi:MAG: MGMT family protein, partial [Chromatiaceae bacterium]